MRFLDGPVPGAGMVQRVESNLATPFGCCDFFDDCTDGIYSLYYKGRLKLLDWMGFNVSDTCFRSVEFIEWVRPDSSGTSGGYVADPCTLPNCVEFGSCKLTVEDFGLYGRCGPERNLFKPEFYCKTRPRYFLDGSPITSEADWDKMFAMDVMLNDIRLALVTGNATTAGQFDGLQRWVNTGYDCPGLDSYVVNWNSNPMSGGAGITINGNPIAATFDLVDVLRDIHAHTKQRIGWSPMLASQTRQVGDTILLMPTFIARCLLDFYTCWSVCPGAQYEEVVKDSKEMREFRITLNGGMFGDGQISLDGDTIPLITYDWGTIVGPTRGDIYYLTGAVGAQRIWEGEHLDANVVPNALMASGAHGFFTSDAGRVLGKETTEALCRTLYLWMALRLFCLAPWAQARIQNVVCNTPLGPLSPSPADSSFFITSSFSAAECP